MDFQVAVYFNENNIYEDEVWRKIGTSEIKNIVPDRYYISNYGRVLNVDSGNILKQVETNNGYIRSFIYSIGDDGKTYGLYRLNHRIEMKEFNPLDNYEHMQVNHINGDKTDNYIGNLEWVTASDNIKHAYDLGLKVKAKTNSRENRLSIEEADKVGQLLSENKYTHKEISNIIGCSIPQVQCISAGVNFKDIYKKYNLESLKREYNG